MFIKKMILAISMIALCSYAFSEDEKKCETSLSTYFGWHPSSKRYTEDIHFSDFDSAYDGLDVAFMSNVDIPFNKDKTLVFNLSAQVTPVSICPSASITYTPFPFLVLNAGGDIGKGWNYLGMKGMAGIDGYKINKDGSVREGVFKDLYSLKYWHYDLFASATLQMDIGYLIPGDWTHVFATATYKTRFEGITSVKDKEFWVWQDTKNNVNGLVYEASFMLGYFMPLHFNMVAVNFSCFGHYNADDYMDNISGKDFYNGKFVTYTVSPVLGFEFTKQDSLNVLFIVSTRRAYSEKSDDETADPFFNYVGYEWFFDSIALFYKHKL